MTDLLYALAASILMAGPAAWLFRKRLAEMDKAAAVGLCGLAGMGLFGTLCLFLGLFSTKLPQYALLLLCPYPLRWLAPNLRFRLGVPGALLIAFVLFGLVGVLAPSGYADWDSAAYHLAVPKIWGAAGKIVPISFIHHSNFPGAVDCLFLISPGSQVFAKGVVLAFSVYGLIAIYGLAREKWGSSAALWAALGFGGVPCVLWESGTAYIDVAHGLFAGLGAWLLLADRRFPMIGALLLGLAVGSKYTGLTEAFTAFAVAAVVYRGQLRAAALPALAALVVGCPWYVKNVMTVGNPVYPFFYEQLGGRNWNQNQADVYRTEQKTFGVPGAGNMAHAILGIAYQPGRYTNPEPKLVVPDSGEPQGANGSPLAAFGFALLAAGMAAAAFRANRPILVWVLVNLILWALLSQQSRYMLSFAAPLALCAAWVIANRPRLPGAAVMGGIAIQLAVSLFVLKNLWLTETKMRVAFGRENTEEYIQRSVPLARANKLLSGAKDVKVGLFDEVFGYYLDVPYFWAGYGHSTEMGYEEMKSSADFLASAKRMGLTHLYVNLRFMPQDFVLQWTSACGLRPSEAGWLPTNPTPMPEDQTHRLRADLQQKWKPFIAELAAHGQLEFAGGDGAYLLFRVK